MQVEPVTGQKMHPQVYLSKPLIDFADVIDAEDRNNKTVRSHDFTCDYHPCPLTFNSLYEKKVHTDTHLFPANTEFKCNICNSVFSCASERNKHVESHSVVNRYKCKNCQHGFPYYTSLVKHIDENKCAAKNNLCPCCFCGAKFVQYSDLERHRQNNLKTCVCQTRVCGEKSFEVHKALCSVYKSQGLMLRKKSKMEESVIVLE